MPVQTRVKPKIARAESPPLTPCADCGTTTAKHVIETYVVRTEEGNDIPTATRKDLCGTCLVGHDVAVCRGPDNPGWCFGEVKAYDGSQVRPFLMSFLDGEEEWAEVCRRPSIQYLNHVGINRLELPPSPPKILPPSPPEILASHSIGSFSSSSFTSVSTNFKCGDDVFPLFEESKLIHLDCSFSSLDESFDEVFSDDEGNIEVLSKTVKTVNFEPSTPKSSQNKSGSRGRRKQRKTRAPNMWTSDEDRNLQSVVDSLNEKGLPLKWPHVAEQCPNRNGKQCRERYMNHLSSAVKSDVWSPEEDASIFSLFFRLGKKWCNIAKMVRGRTDNGAKNRFHHLRRRLEKDVEKKVQKYSSIMSQSDDDESDASIGGDTADAIELKTRKILKILSAETKGGTDKYFKGYVFGPFIVVNEHKMCKRCGLFVPSAQTGETMCTKTEWCEACTMTPTYVAHDLLRECLELRENGDTTVV